MSRRRRSNRRRRGSFRFLSKLLSVLLVCAVIVAALTIFFRVNEVQVVGMHRYTAAEIIETSGVETGDNLFLLNKFEIAQSIMREKSYIEEMSIRRKLPDTLVITVTECGTPLAVSQDGVVWLVSTGGKIVEQRDTASPEYTVIDGCALLAPSVGTQMTFASENDYRLEGLLKLLAALEEKDALDQVRGIHLSDPKKLVMDYLDRFTVEMNYDADFPYKLKTLDAILASGKIQDNMAGRFDMCGEDGKTNFIQNDR